MRKKIISFILIFTLVFINISGVIYGEEEDSGKTMGFNSEAVVLMDSGTGEVLYGKNENKHLEIASVTKIMTVLLVFENIEKGHIKMSDNVTISSYASKMGGSQLFMEEGEQRSVEELLYAVMIESANDACAALGEYTGGSIDNFIDMMNSKAKELGMKNSHFVNSNGLPHENQYSSAKDVALMTRALCKYDGIFKISTTWQKEISIGKNNDKKRMLNNTNKLLKQNSKVDGMKTGYTANAGHCVSATGKSGDLRLISVVLKAPDSKTRFAEANKLLEYGFNSYKAQKVVRENENYTEVMVNKGEDETVNAVAKDDFVTIQKKSENKKYKTKVLISHDIINAPVKKGEKVGKVDIYDGKEKVGSVDLVASKNIKRMNVFNYTKKMFKKFLIK